MNKTFSLNPMQGSVLTLWWNGWFSGSRWRRLHTAVRWWWCCPSVWHAVITCRVTSTCRRPCPVGGGCLVHWCDTTGEHNRPSGRGGDLCLIHPCWWLSCSYKKKTQNKIDMISKRNPSPSSWPATSSLLKRRSFWIATLELQLQYTTTNTLSIPR